MKITRKQLRQIIKEAADTDGSGTLDSQELRQLADELEKDRSVDPVDKLIAYIQTLTPEDEVGLSEVEDMLRQPGRSSEEIDDILEDPRLDAYYDALEDIFAPQETRGDQNPIREVRKRRTLDDIPDITASRTGGPRPKGHPFYDYNPRDFPEKYDTEEVERFPATAASNDELLHSDIVSSVVDTVADTALLNMGKDREDVVLTGIDNEMEGREMDQEEVDFSQIDLQQVFRDVMIDLAAMEKQKLGEANRGDHKKSVEDMISKAKVAMMEDDEKELQTEALDRWKKLAGILKD